MKMTKPVLVRSIDEIANDFGAAYMEATRAKQALDDANEAFSTCQKALELATKKLSFCRDELLTAASGRNVA